MVFMVFSRAGGQLHRPDTLVDSAPSQKILDVTRSWQSLIVDRACIPRCKTITANVVIITIGQRRKRAWYCRGYATISRVVANFGHSDAVAGDDHWNDCTAIATAIIPITANARLAVST
jgi:hypothetical protein